jgi:MFS family permease
MTATRVRLPAGVWMLGFVSLCMDVSSEMIHGLLPVFLVTVVGASALTVGLIEGVSEGIASIMKLFSGALSDRSGKRKPWALAGYGLAALTKPMFPLAHTATTVFVARFVDRIGKGIRGAPRDALVADLVDAKHRGAAFGLRQGLDTVGAFLGPLLAIGLMWLLDGDMRAVFALAVIPAFLSVAILLFFVHEPDKPRAAHAAGPEFSRAGLKRLPGPFWMLMAATVPFTLARFSEAFLVLRTQSLGLVVALVPLTLVVMNVAYSAIAYPAGDLSDRMPRTQLLIAGCVVLFAANACLGFGPTLAWAFAGIVLWGVHMGLTEGLIAALVADYAPADLRGTAFGLLHFVRGVLLLAGSALAGGLWTWFGPPATFAAGGVFSLLTIVALLFVRRAPAPHSA